MRKGVLSSLFYVSLLVLPSVSLAGGCESGMKSTDAYAAMLNYSSIMKSLMNAPDKVNKAKTQWELQESIEGLDNSVSILSPVRS